MNFKCSSIADLGFMLEKLPDKVNLYLAVFISLNRSHGVH